MSLIGIHVSGIANVVEIINKNKIFKNLGLVQIFVSATANYSDEKYNKIKAYMKSHKIKIVVHASYSINLARRWTELDWWIQQLIGEIEAANDLGAFAIIIHTGKKLELSDAVAINNMYTSLLYVHERTNDKCDVKILIETPSGQGTEVLTKLEDLCRFLGKFYKHPDKKLNERIGMCFDTCHVFASGYDIRTLSDINDVFGIIDKSIGINRIKVCHINDSKKGLGSKLDRHENIGSGEIGKNALLKIINFMKVLEIPMILETPSTNVRYDYELLVKLLSKTDSI